MGDTIAGSSLLQAHAEKVHREHDRFHHAHNLIKLRKKQAPAIVTAVTQTVSVIQQIQVDTNGSTIQVQTVLADSTVEAPTTAAAPVTSADPLTVTSASATAETTPTADAMTASDTGSVEVQAATDSLLPSQSLQTSQVTALPSTASSFPSIIISNSSSIAVSSTLASSSSSSTNISNYLSTSLLSFSNSTITSSSSSPSSTDSSDFTTTSSIDPSIYLYGSSRTTSQTAGATGGGGVVSTNPTSATNTAAAGGSSSSSSDSSTPSTPVVIGSVMGSVAGFAVLVFVVLVILRWHRRNRSILPLGSSPDHDGAAALTGGSGQPPTGPMTERSLPFAIPAALASLTGYKHSSQQPSIGASSTAGSEKGFYRVSGRKITSVLESGGDGWGNDLPEDPNTLSGASFYRDSRGFYSSHGSPPSPLGGLALQRDSGVPVSRPSPARTPVISQGPFASFALPPEAELPRRPDGVGRSHPSHDGSKGSRFTEEV